MTSDIEFLIEIGNLVCDECGEYRDCGFKYEECGRLYDAEVALNKFLKSINKDA